MTEILTSLPDVTPLSCMERPTFTELNRVITQLMIRDRVLEEAVLAFTDEAFLQNTVKLLNATKLILGPDTVDAVIAAGQLPVGFEPYDFFQLEVKSRLDALELNTTILTGDLAPRTLKSVVEGNQTTLAALSEQMAAFQSDLDKIKALTNDIVAVKATVDALNARVATLESVVAQVSDELRIARKEFSTDPSKKLIDKIDAMDSIAVAQKQRIDALAKEIIDARSADRFDTLAEHIGDIEGQINTLQDTLEALQGKGSVNGVKAGRSILHGVVELIPGSNIAITRERNGFRIDVVDFGTCVDLSAPKIDANNCCGPGNPNFGN